MKKQKVRNWKFLFNVPFFVPSQPGSLRSRIIFWTPRIRTNCMASIHSMDWWWLWSHFHWKSEGDETTYNEKAAVMKLFSMKRRCSLNYFQWKGDEDETTLNEKLMVMKLYLQPRNWLLPPPLTQFQSVRKKNRKQRPIYDIAQTICLREFFFFLAYST